MMELHSPTKGVLFCFFFGARFESSPLCLLHPKRVIDIFKNTSFPCKNYFAHTQKHIQEASAPEVLLVQHPVFGMFSHARIPIKTIIGEEATKGHTPKAQDSLFSMVGQFLDMS